MEDNFHDDGRGLGLPGLNRIRLINQLRNDRREAGMSEFNFIFKDLPGGFLARHHPESLDDARYNELKELDPGLSQEDLQDQEQRWGEEKINEEEL